MQNNTIKLNKNNINLVELLGQVTAYFEYQFKKVNMESRVRFSEDKLIVNGDGEKLVVFLKIYFPMPLNMVRKAIM